MIDSLQQCGGAEMVIVSLQLLSYWWSEIVIRVGDSRLGAAACVVAIRPESMHGVVELKAERGKALQPWRKRWLVFLELAWDLSAEVHVDGI